MFCGRRLREYKLMSAPFLNASRRMPSNFRSNTHSGPLKRSCVKVAAIGLIHSGNFPVSGMDELYTGAFLSVVNSAILAVVPSNPFTFKLRSETMLTFKIALLFTLALIFLISGDANPRRLISNTPSPGNIPDGMYSIVGEASHRCLEVPNNSCASAVALQTFDCDRTEASNNQKFNVVSDGSGNYTISPVH